MVTYPKEKTASFGNICPVYLKEHIVSNNNFPFFLQNDRRKQCAIMAYQILKNQLIAFKIRGIITKKPEHFVVSAAPNENIVQDHLNIALLNVF